MDNSPIFMLNALWFKADGGAERYQEYIAAAGAVMKKLEVGAKMHSGFQPVEMLIGHWDPDLFFVVEYPNKQTFERFVNSDEYGAIKHLREEAIVDSLLVQCKRPG